MLANHCVAKAIVIWDSPNSVDNLSTNVSYMLRNWSWLTDGSLAVRPAQTVELKKKHSPGVKECSIVTAAVWNSIAI